MTKEYTKEISCPYCSWEHGDSWEYEQDEGEVECDNCNKKFDWKRNIEVDYCSYKKECEGKHDLVIREDFPCYIKQKEIVFGESSEIIWEKLPRKKWVFNECYVCKECDYNENKDIGEEEFKKKYPYKYERELKEDE